ncbi:hypothetical protein [Hydrogenophaga sp.]|uniref:hypothetical protein n=1 Tax=Hydrogenophaga sp. TaxID=1904254 RepID=UPI00272646C3|nr:hypothetical protein [Hydrogenophaga sp.]MDO9437476.1 hypothetical protein [Hydrogenophaga sp.]
MFGANDSSNNSRANPYVGVTSATEVTSDPTKRDLLTDWKSRLDKVALADPSTATALLERVVNGLVHPVAAAIAQAVFNDLIAHEAYDLFADVFNAYNPHVGEAPSSLTLRLPQDWICTAPAARDAAFARIQVQRLEIVRPPIVPPDSAAHDNALASDDDDHEDQPPERVALADLAAQAHRDTPVSAAACDCIAALLRLGLTTELVVHGALASPERVVEALAFSPLVSIELGDTEATILRLSATEQQTYKTLVSGLAHCPALTHLTLGHAELANLHQEMEALLVEGALKLTSVKLAGHAFDVPSAGEVDEMNDIDSSDEEVGRADEQRKPIIEIASFVRAVAKIKTLTEFKVNAFADSVDKLSAIFLKPLEHHPALTRLEVVRTGEIRVIPQNKKALPTVIAFAKNCPALTHFTWAVGTLVTSAGDHMDQQRAMGAEVLMSHDVKAMADTLRGDASANRTPYLGPRRAQVPSFRLQSLALIGMPLSSDAIRALLQSLELTNSPLRDLNLSGGFMDAQAAAELINWLQNNLTLNTLELPHHASAYYVRSKDGRIHGLGAQAPGGDSRALDPRETFRLKVSRNANLLETKNAQEAFNALPFKSPQALQDRLQRNALARHALPELQRRVAPLMAVASGSLQPSLFNDVSGLVASYLLNSLLNAHQVSSAIHLSEANKAMGRLLHDATTAAATGKTPEVVKQVIRQDNKGAERRKPRRVPASVNTVNARGANAKLLAAAHKNKVELLRELKRKDAIDFGGQAQQAVTSFDALDALQGPMKGGLNTRNTTTTVSIIAPQLTTTVTATVSAIGAADSTRTTAQD